PARERGGCSQVLYGEQGGCVEVDVTSTETEVAKALPVGIASSGLPIPAPEIRPSFATPVFNVEDLFSHWGAGYSPSTIRRWLRTGKIKSIEANGKVVIPYNENRDLLSEMRSRPRRRNLDVFVPDDLPDYSPW